MAIKSHRMNVISVLLPNLSELPPVQRTRRPDEKGRLPTHLRMQSIPHFNGVTTSPLRAGKPRDYKTAKPALCDDCVSF
jgi:hypothetical protein